MSSLTLNGATSLNFDTTSSGSSSSSNRVYNQSNIESEDSKENRSATASDVFVNFVTGTKGTLFLFLLVFLDKFSFLFFYVTFLVKIGLSVLAGNQINQLESEKKLTTVGDGVTTRSRARKSIEEEAKPVISKSKEPKAKRNIIPKAKFLAIPKEKKPEYL